MQISRGIIKGAQKCVLYGAEGIGKSTLAAQFPNPLFSDTEDSTKHMDVARFPKPSSWTMLMQQAQYIKANPSICDTYIIDTGDWAEKLCREHVCSSAQKNSISDFGHGQGYVRLMEEFGRLLNLLTDIIETGINVVIVCHAAMRKFELPDETGSYDRWEMKLEKKVFPLIKEWSDMILFCNYETTVVNVDGQGAQKGKNKAQGGKRVMFTSHHPCWDAKNRHGLADKLPLEYSAIAHCIPARGGNAPAIKELPTNEVRYWHHPESGCVYITTPGDPDHNGSSDGMSCELNKEQYAQLFKKYSAAEAKSEPAAPTPTTTAATASLPQKQPDPKPAAEVARSGTVEQPGPNIPKALADLMRVNNVTTAEIQKAVASRGYYPVDTPIENYDPKFISGVLVGAWKQVFAMIEQIRPKNTYNLEDIPA